MRRITTLLASAIGLAFMSQATFAAGIPVKAAGPPPPPPFSWTGCYVGAFTGYKSGGVQEYEPVGVLVPGNPALPLSSYDLVDGAVLGGDVGCQFQTGVWVFGIAADGAWTSLSGKGFPPNTDFALKAEENWFGTVRGKVGFAINRWWGYVTGGWAWANWTQRTTFPLLGFAIEDTQTIDGWVIGAGMDYAFTNHWVFNAEFLYMDYGKNNWYNPPDSGACVQAGGFVIADMGCDRDIEHTNFLLKVGFKYMFGGLF